MNDVKETIHYDQLEDRLTIHREQDVEPLLNETKARRNDEPMRFQHEVFNMAARIPMVIVEQWIREGINVFNPGPEDQRKIRQKLNGDYKYLKTTSKRI